MKRKLLFISKCQFGYNTDYYNYVKFLSGKYDITFLSVYDLRQKIEIENTFFLYIEKSNSKILNFLKFHYYAFKQIKNHHYDLILCHYFRTSFFIRLYTLNKKVLLDIRTGSVDKNVLKRKLFNSLLTFETFFFKYITCISEGLKISLKLSSKTKIINLGGEPQNNDNRNYNYGNINILYVGTLTNRDIHKTLIGFKMYLEERNEAVSIHYHIVGVGQSNEKFKLMELVNKLEISKDVTLHGYVEYSRIADFLNIAHIGVSFVPITTYFNFQPPTKTFEYLHAGIPVIATNTYENMKIINRHNGVLIKDNPTDFKIGLHNIIKDLKNYKTDIIKNSVEDYTWVKVVEKLDREINHIITHT